VPVPAGADGDETAPDPLRGPGPAAATAPEPGRAGAAAPEPAAPPPSANVVSLTQETKTLGEMLLEARAASNLSIGQVSERTRIARRFIENLETDRAADLPPPVYTRSYITQLCREYGIAADEILAEYDRVQNTLSGSATNLELTAEEDAGTATVRYIPPGQEVEALTRRPIGLTRYLVGGLLALVLILALAAIAAHQWQRHRRAAPGAGDGGSRTPAPAVRFEDYAIPQQLPLEELPVPEG